MTATATRPYSSGWHQSGQDERCVGEYAGTKCTHPFHELLAGAGDVNAVSDVPAKDALKESPVSGVPASEAPASIYLALSGEVEDLSREIASLLDELREVEALDILAAVRAARQGLAQIESVVEARAAKLMTGNVVEWPGGVAERKYGKNRTEWKNDDLIDSLIRVVAGEFAASPEGEIDEMLAALLADAVRRYAETNRPSWRVTALKAMGVDPDVYCHAIPGRVSVQITQAGAA